MKNNNYLLFNLKNTLFIILFIISFYTCFSQKNVPKKALFDGRVSGYYQNTSNTASKKDRQIKLEGALDSVAVRVYKDKETVFSIKTNKKGIFKLALQVENVYKLELTKKGYLTTNLIIDLKNIPEDVASKGLIFENLEILVNSYNNGNSMYLTLPFGRLFFDENTNSFKFEEKNAKVRKGILSKEKIENPAVSIIEQAILKNKENFLKQNAKENDVTYSNRASVKNDNAVIPKSIIASKVVLINSKIKKFTSEEINLRERELFNEREKLKKDKLLAKTEQDSLLIIQRESILNMAESELIAAKKFIKSQEDVISKQRWVLILILGFLFLLLVFLYVVIKNHQQKKATNLLLNKKNKNITDSINYALKIQQSILLSDEEVKKIVPNSFIFYQPRDIVSGDFYWFSKEDDKIIIAAVDCTGHGVPGAFMSFLGYSLMNQIIIEKKVTRPSEILNKLHEGIVKLLRQKSGKMNVHDGMELSLCVYNKNTSMLEYSGAMNPVYIVINNEIITLLPDEFSIGEPVYNEKTKIKFTDKKIKISENDILYLFSDGYTDQFGGEQNIKYNTLNFKNLLLEIHDKQPHEQKLIVENSINSWKGKYKQIDDMLIIGAKFKNL